MTWFQCYSQYSTFHNRSATQGLAGLSLVLTQLQDPTVPNLPFWVLSVFPFHDPIGDCIFKDVPFLRKLPKDPNNVCRIAWAASEESWASYWPGASLRDDRKRERRTQALPIHIYIFVLVNEDSYPFTSTMGLGWGSTFFLFGKYGILRLVKTITVSHALVTSRMYYCKALWACLEEHLKVSFGAECSSVDSYMCL